MKNHFLKEQMHETHPQISNAFSALKKGEISRREFVRFATLLGMSATLATACGGLALGASVPEESDENNLTSSNDQANNNGGPQFSRGGTLTIGAEFQAIKHPATLSWPASSNIVRQVAEYLTLTDKNNITTPYLLDRWETNLDVSEWILYLRRGIFFNNGDELTADDVVFNFNQWLNPDIGSSMLGLLAYIGGPQNITKLDDYTIKLRLDSPNIGLPEHLFNYPAVIMHRSFQGDFIEQPIGTGPFTLTEYALGDRAVLTSRDDYWQKDENGLPLPYLDQIIYTSISKDDSVRGLQSGDVDSFYNPRPSDWQTLKDNPDVVIESVPTAQTLILRVRVDQGPPWDDIRVRQALRKIQDRGKILSSAFFGEGDLGTDSHIAPVHPAYDPRPVPEYDPQGARALLEEWAAETGNTLPIKATIVTKNDDGEKEYAEVLQEGAIGSGFEFDLDITDPDGYWDRWDTVPMGITAWTHRPLSTMVLPLGYIADAAGNPVPWNETRWVDSEFMAVLNEAQATLNVTQRREKIKILMDIFEERGPIGVAFFKNVWRINHKRVHNLPGHPTNYDLLTHTWVEPKNS